MLAYINIVIPLMKDASEVKMSDHAVNIIASL